jgi:hypothetical protein
MTSNPPLDLLTDEAEALFVPMLRAAGCQCVRPLLGWRPEKGPRCRLCNAEAAP